MRPGRYVLVLGAFGFQRLVELAYSARNEARVRRLEPVAPRAAAYTFKWMVILNAALFSLPLLENFRRHHPPPAAIQALGWTGALAAAGLRLWAIVTLRDQWNVRAIVPQRLRVVDAGPYRWVRHPNYVAVALEFASLPLIGGAYRSAVCLSLLNGIALWDRIRSEEALLDALPAYRERMAGKPRFLPRWRDLRALAGVASGCLNSARN